MLPHEKEHEKEAFRQMSLRKKAEHFLTYYWIPTGLILAALLFGGILCYHMFLKPRENCLLSAAVFDDLYDETAQQEMTEELRTLLGADGPQDTVFFDTAYRSGSAQDRMRISVLTASSEYEIIIAEEEFFAELAGNGYFADLSGVLSGEALARLEPHLLTLPGRAELEHITAERDGSGEGEPAPYGVSLKDSRIYARLGGHLEKPAAGIVVSSNRMENAEAFLCYLYPAE